MQSRPGPILAEPYEISASAVIESHRQLANYIQETPAVSTRALSEHCDCEVWLKLELMQVCGSFKPRGAILRMLAMSEDERHRGLCAASAGNHAAAVAYAARAFSTQATIFMPRSASPARLSLCRSLGAKVRVVDTIHEAFARAESLAESEGCSMIHPFEGRNVALGTATLAREFLTQVPVPLDALVVPVGGGGLISGISWWSKHVQPSIRVYGVEPVGADSLYRSFRSGRPESLSSVDTIADSLASPHATRSHFGICRDNIDEIVRVTDDALCAAMAALFHHAKLAVEPAGAAATAALRGPLASTLRGKRVGLVVCGANIDPENYTRWLLRGRKTEQALKS